MHLEERIDLIEKLDNNLNSLIELMTNYKKSFNDCFYEWYGYYYYLKDRHHDDNDLTGLKNIIMNFMYSDKMKEVLTFDKQLYYDDINCYY